MEQLQLLDFERDYFEFLLSDELEQFKDERHKVTRALLKAFAKQFNDLLATSKEVHEKTYLARPDEINPDDPRTYGATDAQLDGCGDIVKLTRAQAAMLSNEVTTDVSSIQQEVLDSVKTPMDVLAAHAPNGIVPFDVIDDNRYREYLWFKIFLNTNHCTFPDVVKALEAFWTRSQLHYTERPVINGRRCHATIKVSTAFHVGSQLPGESRAWAGHEARLYFLIPIIKAAGVLLLREATTTIDMKPGTVRIKPLLTQTVARVTLPQVIMHI